MAGEEHSGHRQRVRTKILYDSSSLLDHELLEALLFSAVPRQNVNPLAHRLLSQFGSLERLFRASPKALMAMDGVGEAVAAQIVLTGELHRRALLHSDEECYVFNTRDACECFRTFFFPDEHESLAFLYLDARGKVLARSLDKGDDEDAVNAKFKHMVVEAVAVKASAVILAHNHPSGCSQPSAEDIDSTARLVDLCLACGIRLRDHIIFGTDEYFSFRDHDILPKGADRRSLL